METGQGCYEGICIWHSSLDSCCMLYAANLFVIYDLNCAAGGFAGGPIRSRLVADGAMPEGSPPVQAARSQNSKRSADTMRRAASWRHEEGARGGGGGGGEERPAGGPDRAPAGERWNPAGNAPTTPVSLRLGHIMRALGS